jgi:oligopeptidase B
MAVVGASCTTVQEPVNNQESKEMTAPVAEKIKKELTIHDDTRVDNYFWMKDREDQKVVAHLESENKYTEGKLKHTEALQASLYDEIVGRIKQTDESVPYMSNGYLYYTRYEEGQEYAIYCRKLGDDAGAEEIMLNVNELAKDQAYCATSGHNVSNDNKILAYGVDFVSRRQYTINFKNLETGEVYSDALANASGSVAWTKDNKTVFYTLNDEQTLRSYRVMRHLLGTAQSEDVEVFTENDDTFGAFVYRSKSRDYIILGSYATMTSEYQVLDASDATGNFTVFQPRERGHEYSISHYNDQFYVHTNWDAQNFRVMTTSVNGTTKDNWKEVIAHRPDVLIEGVDLFQNYMVVQERENGLNQLRVMPHDHSAPEHYIAFDEQTYSAWTGTNPEFMTDILRFGYTSLTTPNSVFDYSMATKERELKKQQEVVGGYNADEYHAERVEATAPDGTKVPISLVYKKGLVKDGSNPLLLYAYGSYGASMDPYFSTVRLSLLDRGFVYAIAHIRGGEDLGRGWYEDGKLLNKINTFTDFIACADYLTEEQFTSSDKLCAMGGSAGGLLMGAVINMGGERFKAVVAAVPFVDVISTMLDDEIPLTTGEYDEWGNPNEKKYYDYMLSYSPYDNVTAKAYPAMLVTTGFHDSQVQYWEPAKWVAKLRELKTNDENLLLHCNMEAGHGGASGRFQRYKETALEYAFLLNELGMVK